MPPKQSTDLGAALRGLLLGGSVLFLLLLTIVWLTNRRFEGKNEAAVGSAQPTAGAPHISPTTPGAESASVAPGPAAPPAPPAPPATGAAGASGKQATTPAPPPPAPPPAP
jgi:hypothetical protein